MVRGEGQLKSSIGGDVDRRREGNLELGRRPADNFMLGETSVRGGEAGKRGKEPAHFNTKKNIKGRSGNRRREI